MLRYPKEGVSMWVPRFSGKTRITGKTAEIPERPKIKNAGQLGLGSSRPESSGPGSTGPDNISAWSYFAYFFIRDASLNCVLYIKCSAKV